MKKLLAILCVVAVLFCSLFTGVVVSAEDAGLTKLSPSVDQMAAVTCNPSAPSHYRKPFHNATYTAMVQTIGSANEYLSFKNGNAAFTVFFGNANQVEFRKSGLTTVDGSALANYTAGGDFKARFFKIEITSKVVDEKLNIVVKLDDQVAGDFTFNEANAFNTTYSSREFAAVIVYDVDYTLRADENIVPGMLLTQKTLSDYNLPQGAYYSADPGLHVAKVGAIASSIDTIFSMNFMLETNGFVRYPSFSNRKGFILKAVGENLVLDGSDFATELGLDDASNLATITAADLGLSAIVGADLKYQVSIEAVNTDDEALYDDNENLIFEVKNDIRFNFYLNGKNIYSKTVKGTMTGYEEVYDENENIVGLQNIVTEGGITLFERVPAPEGQAGTYTLNTLYIKNGEFTDYTTAIPYLPVRTYDDAKFTSYSTDANGQVSLANSPAINTVFGAKITFNKTGGQYMFLGIGAFNLAADGRLAFNDFTKVNYLTDYDMTGKAFDLKIVSKGVSVDGGAYPNDVQLQIFIDNTLKYTAYHENAIARILNKGSFVNPNTGMTIEKADFVPNGLQQLTPADGGFAEDRTITFPATDDNKHEDDYIQANDLYIGCNKKASNVFKLLGSVFHAKITNNLDAGGVQLFNAGGTQIKCTISAANQIQVDASGIFFSSPIAIPVAKGTEFDFKFVLQYSGFDEDGNGLLDDIRFGVFIDGQLLGGKFWSMMDRDLRYYAVDETTKAKLVSWTSFAFRTQAYCAGGAKSTTGSITIKNPVDLSEAYKNYETITLDDYGIIAGTYSPDANNNIHANWRLSNDVLTVNGKVLKATFNIPVSSKEMWLSFVANGIGSHGLHFKFASNGGAVALNNSKGSVSAYSLPDFKYGVAQEWYVSYEFEADGKIKLGVWIDGKLQNNAFAYANSYGASSDTRAISLYKPGDTATITFGDNENNFTNYEIAEGGYVFTPAAGQTYTYGETEITAAAPYTFEAVGEYAVTYTAAKGGNAIVGQKTIVVYKASDLNADNEVNILDFIIAKKNAAGERELTSAVARAAAGKYDVTELCDAYDIADIKAAVLG